jgi:hypothetical protein
MVAVFDKLRAPAQKDSRPMLSQLTFQEALRLTANFAFTADRMRQADRAFAVRANICETASRVAFLRAHIIARREKIIPEFGECLRQAVFSVV